MRKLFIACTLMLVLIALVGAVGINGPGVSLPKSTGNTVSLAQEVIPLLERSEPVESNNITT